MASKAKRDDERAPELKLPKGEESWVGYYNRSGRRIFLLTSKLHNREWYYLYEVQTDGQLKKLGRAHTPTELEEKFHVIEKMHEE